MAGSPTFLSDGHTPRVTDPLWAIEQKILGALVDGAGGGGGSGSGAVLEGAVDPVAAPADPTMAALYTNTATGTVWIWHTGTLVWQQIV